MSDVQKKPGRVRRFFGGLMRFLTVLRVTLMNLLFVVMIVLLIKLFSGTELPDIPDRGALILNPNGYFVEQHSLVDPLAHFWGTDDTQEHEIVVHDVIRAIDHAIADERITSLVMELDGLSGASLSQLQEVAMAVARFRASGKPVIAVGDNYSQNQYWLATQADEIYIHPMGAVLLQGYSVYRNYFHQALDKLAVDFHVFRVGEFKSAVEPYIRDDMSEAAKISNLAWLSDLWSDYIVSVTSRRKLPGDAVTTYINTMDTQLQGVQGSTAKAAVAAGLVDAMKSRDEANDYLAERVGGKNEDGLYYGVGFETYLWMADKAHPLSTGDAVVGIIVAEGNIVDGYQPPGTIGGDSLAELIRDARNDDRVKSVLLRINSGGGSAFASEIIRRELELLRAAGKPLVVSMSSVAASGGYWIAAQADEIWAMPTTLTGSIGIFGALPTLDRALGKLGVNTDGVGTTELAGSLRIDRPLNPTVAAVLQSSIEYGYQQFLALVADGRDMSVDDVDKIASGRVWSGKQAMSLGLVDHLGGLQPALAAAAQLAGLSADDYEYLELPLSPREQILQTLGLVIQPLTAQFSTQISELGSWLNPLASVLKQWQWMNDPKGMYAYCSFCLAP